MPEPSPPCQSFGEQKQSSGVLLNDSLNPKICSSCLSPRTDTRTHWYLERLQVRAMITAFPELKLCLCFERMQYHHPWSMLCVSMLKCIAKYERQFEQVKHAPSTTRTYVIHIMYCHTLCLNHILVIIKFSNSMIWRIFCHMLSSCTSFCLYCLTVI